MELLKNFTVLYIENENKLVSKAKQILENKVKKLYLENEIENGSKVYKEFKPDILVIDIDISNGDAIKFCEEIYSVDEEQSIIVITAQKNISTVEKIINLGISKIIFKPLVKFDRLFQEIISSSKNIQNKIDANNLKLLKIKEEREEFLLGVIKQISHHWKQPLNIISTLSSTCSYKKEMGIETSADEDIESANLITRKTLELANILDVIDKIDYKNITIEEIEELIKVSNPIYPRAS